MALAGPASAHENAAAPVKAPVAVDAVDAVSSSPVEETAAAPIEVAVAAAPVEAAAAAPPAPAVDDTNVMEEEAAEAERIKAAKAAAELQLASESKSMKAHTSDYLRLPETPSTKKKASPKKKRGNL